MSDNLRTRLLSKRPQVKTFPLMGETVTVRALTLTDSFSVPTVENDTDEESIIRRNIWVLKKCLVSENDNNQKLFNDEDEEILRQWPMSTEVVKIITFATGTINVDVENAEKK